MDVSEACRRRMSVRAFRADPVSGDLVRELLTLAQRAAPSGGNLQPWYVYGLAGEPLEALKHAVRGKPVEGSEYHIYPPDMGDPYRRRSFECGEDMYATMGIARGDREARLRHIARNTELFGAPVGLFFCLDRTMGPPQWGDVGMLMQSVMLLAIEHGLDTCAQEYWAMYPRSVARALDLPDTQMLYSGMALGYRDPNAPVNSLRTRREPFANFASLRGL